MLSDNLKNIKYHKNQFGFWLHRSSIPYSRGKDKLFHRINYGARRKPLATAFIINWPNTLNQRNTHLYVSILIVTLDTKTFAFLGLSH